MEAESFCVDGNEAAVDVAYRLTELCALYPITPSSPMGEKADLWRMQGRPNLWGHVPDLVEMQSEGGAAAALHGAAQAGSLACSFTSSQGLLLMLPTLYKLAGELCPVVLHIAARAVATHALSIFGDHSDVMSARATGVALLSSASVQEAHDFALIAHAAALKSRLPFLHFFDGFRTSHEVRGIERLQDEQLRALLPMDELSAFRERALSPDHPLIRGTSQNPDVFFQSREAANLLYDQVPDQVDSLFDQLSAVAGRRYHCVEYVGAPNASELVVIMGSGGHTVRAFVEQQIQAGEAVGMIHLRLYRPFPKKAFLKRIPETVRSISVLDRCKESGSPGEPLYLDVAACLQEARPEIRMIGGRYGLGGKEFTPAMVASAFANLQSSSPLRSFSLGITDDVSQRSLAHDESFHLEQSSQLRALFYGLGSDGTVGATKSSVQILNRIPQLSAQGYFVYDSNKSGARTVSHLRAGENLGEQPYQILKANFIACHQFSFLEQIDVLRHAENGATLLLNVPNLGPSLARRIPRPVQEHIRQKRLKLYVIPAQQLARECGLGGHINVIMQAAFFHLSGLLSPEQSRAELEQSVRNNYARKGPDLVDRNLRALDLALRDLTPLDLSHVKPGPELPERIPRDAPEFVRNFSAALLEERGDTLPVSAMPLDGSFPLSTAKYNKRDLSDMAPLWDSELCIQCGNCVAICPHSVIRSKQAAPEDLEGAPEGFQAPRLRGPGEQERRFLLQLHLQDCTGCGLCIEICPAKDRAQANRKALQRVEKTAQLERNRVELDFFQNVPAQHEQTQSRTLRGLQYVDPYFEFPGACAGCGETGYVKMLSQLFGDRMLVANATGCSSIYGGNLPTTPWSTDDQGRGPAWANSLFEDNAEFGLGFRLAVDQQRKQTLQELRSLGEEDLAAELEAAPLGDPVQRDALRIRLQELSEQWKNRNEMQSFLDLCDAIVDRSVWIVGGDGWACDIGFGGLDHVLSTGRNVNVLVLDTEVYSNTGGQASKSTPLGAIAKFAAAGKQTPKTDLAMHGILKGNTYVATIALGAKLPQALRAFREAEAWHGPSLILAYSPCIAHGYPMSASLSQQKRAVESGHWPLFRYHPELDPPLEWDSPEQPSLPLKEYIYNELRYKLLERSRPEQAEEMLAEAKRHIHERYEFLKRFSVKKAAST